MKTRTLLSTLLIGGVLAGAAMPVIASAGPHRASIAHRLMRVADEIGLTEDQKSQIKGILEANKPEAEALRAEMRTTMKALDEAITSGADNDTIAELAIDAHGLRADVRALKREVRKEIGGVLTPEQKAQLKQMRAERRREHGGRDGGNRGGRGQAGFGGL